MTTDPDRLYWDDDVAEGIALRLSGDGVQWGLGSLALRCDVRYGERNLQKFADAIGVAYDTLVDYRSVARAFPLRTGDLPYHVYRALSRLPEALREEWAEQAERDHWTVARARKSVTEFLTAPPEKEEPQRKKNLGMKAVPDKRVTLFRNVADAFEAVIEQEEKEYAEPEDIASRLSQESRDQIERAIALATEFMGRWRHILDLQDEMLNPDIGPDEDGIERVRDEEWPPVEVPA